MKVIATLYQGTFERFGLGWGFQLLIAGEAVDSSPFTTKEEADEKMQAVLAVLKDNGVEVARQPDEVV